MIFNKLKKFIYFKNSKNENIPSDINSNEKLENSSFVQVNKNSFFSFIDLVCFKAFIVEKNKRNFFKLASRIVSSKLSFEFQLKNYFNIEKLILAVLNKEQLDIFNQLPNFRIEKQLNQIEDLNKF